MLSAILVDGHAHSQSTDAVQ